MLRVRNSFLQYEPEVAAGARPRFRSLEVAESGASSLYCQEETLDRLNEVIRSGVLLAPSSKEQVVHVELQTSVLSDDAKAQMSKLKTVQSNSSVSTMAPTDDVEDYDEDTVASPQGQDFDMQDSYSQYGIGSKSFQHVNVPKSLNLAEEFSKAAPQGPPTTMMIRNIPNRYSQRELIRELENLGFAGTFDFFYAPIDTGTMGNVGYAFINFVDPAWAEHCQQLVTGYTFKKHQQKTRRKIATVSVAHLQGLEANIRHYENSAVNGRNRSKRCGPVILTNIAGALPSVDEQQ